MNFSDINNDQLIFCDICARNGFPREAIRFVQVGSTKEVFSFDFIVSKVVMRGKYFVYNYFEGGRHFHKCRAKKVIEEAA